MIDILVIKNMMMMMMMIRIVIKSHKLMNLYIERANLNRNVSESERERERRLERVFFALFYSLMKKDVK